MENQTVVTDSIQIAAEAIRSEIVKTCRNQLGSTLRAVVLTGSVARDEGSLIRNDAGWLLLGDIDVLAVIRDGRRACAGVELSHEVEDALMRRGITAQVGISVVTARFLTELRPQMFAYELRECGQVLDGDHNILQLVPTFSPSEIPLEDGFRTLCNRIIEQLPAIASYNQMEPSLPHELEYVISKFYLEMATSLLLFVGEYAPTYSTRAERLKRIDVWPSDLPVNFGRFTKRVIECTELKLHPAHAHFTVATWVEAIEYARALWTWELKVLRARQHGFQRLVSSVECIGCESFAQWLRGWLRLLNHEKNWRRNWRYWRRWLLLCRYGSPRYLIYSVAAELLFWAPSVILGQEYSSMALNACQLRLPLGDQGSETRQYCWHDLANETSRSYRDLLVATRS